VGGWILRNRASLPGLTRVGAALCGVLVAQMAVGEVQYRNALPWWLVLIHVLLGAAIWTLTVAMVHALWRPPLPLLSPRLEPAQPSRASTAASPPSLTR
jgi:heme A synthase